MQLKFKGNIKTKKDNIDTLKVIFKIKKIVIAGWP